MLDAQRRHVARRMCKASRIQSGVHYFNYIASGAVLDRAALIYVE
jgi:hypothetical protein